MSNNTPQLQVSELYKRRQAKDFARLRAYNQILETIYHRIRVQSNMPNSPCNLLYTIPPFILGLPKIDLEDCVVYVVYQLRQSGFEVRYSYPNMISISWMHHERSYITEQSPIMQAMLATATPPPNPAFTKKPKAPKAPKAGGGKSVHFAGSAGSTTGGGPSVGHLPSAEEYVPPTAFLQTMDTPGPKAQSKPGNVVMGGVLADLWR